MPLHITIYIILILVIVLIIFGYLILLDLDNRKKYKGFAASRVKSRQYRK